MKRKRKLRKRFLIFILFIIIIGIGVFIFFKFKNKGQYDDALLSGVDASIREKLEGKKYSKTLEEALLNNVMIEEYIDEYINIEYLDKDNFLSNVNALLKLGYKADEINNIFKMSDKNIDKILNSKYMNLSEYYNISNFNADNYDRYEAYKNEKKVDAKTSVTHVNIGVDLDPYEKTNITDKPNDYLVLVNKYNGIAKNFEPNDLVSATGYYGTVKMRKVLKEALEKLQSDIKNEIGTTLLPTTAYRNYAFQSTLYNNYVSQDGKEKADTYSARPGFSEHQTGLAVDLKNPTLTDVRLDEKDYEWVKNNAYKYGLIVRFPKNKELLTGYQEENWHLRYVGDEAAKIIHDNDLCLEEYIDLYVTQY